MLDWLCRYLLHITNRTTHIPDHTFVNCQVFARRPQTPHALHHLIQGALHLGQCFVPNLSFQLTQLIVSKEHIPTHEHICIPYHCVLQVCD